MIIDTHAHLYWDSFKEDLDQIIQKALDSGVTGIINVGVDIETSQKALNQLESLQGLTSYSTIGIHPHEALRYTQDKLSSDIAALEKIYQQNPKKVIAVGECGLDFKEINGKDKDLQRELFQGQINLAKKLNLPLLVHCRDDRSQNPTSSECWDEVINMTKDHFGVYHCYSGLPQTTSYLLQETSFYISFAGNLTYPKNEYLKEAVKVIPLDRILVETDCPFLPPQSHRGQRNEPSYIVETLQTIAEIKDLPVEKVESAIFTNTTRLFNI